MTIWISRIIKLLFLIFTALAFSCEEQGIFANCDDCSVDEPTNARLEFTFDKAYFKGIIEIYEGNIEDSILFATLNYVGSSTSLTVNLNKLYTATTTYYIPGDYFIVVDSATPRVKYTETQCEEPCYYVYDTKLDLRLK